MIKTVQCPYCKENTDVHIDIASERTRVVECDNCGIEFLVKAKVSVDVQVMKLQWRK